MKNLLNPKWIFLVNTLPIFLLFFLGFQEFSVIKTLLEPETVWLWKSYSFWLFFLGLINFGFAVFMVIKKYKIKADFAFYMLVSSITYLYLYYYFIDDILPRSIPRWMLSGETMYYVGTFLMPTLAYSLFVLVLNFTPKKRDYNPWRSFGFALAVPIFFYILLQLILPLYKNVESNYNDHLIIIIIAGTLFFLFFLIRGMYILLQKQSEFLLKYQLVWKILFTLVLPVLGLLVNAGFLFPSYSFNESRGIFGNFNSFWFYLLVIFNGILLSIPHLEKKNLRILLFILRSFTFAFTFYFFIVFLPFLPFSVIAIIAVGLGFLMLSPLALFIIHINQLARDFSYLKRVFSKKLLRVVFIISFLVIPSAITIEYLQDKKILNDSLEYIYMPDFSKNYDISRSSLRKTLDVVISFKDRRDNFLSNGNIPYLSSYFNWLVLDHLTLSDHKISTIEKVFFNKTDVKNEFISTTKDSVVISKVSSRSTFDSSQKVWKTWVDLEIANKSGTDWNKEFSTTFRLPDACFISDYYLMVGNKKEFGILAEKKSAMWIYNQITSQNRDPGILYYLTGNKVEFKVFPFSKNEVRNTGIEFLHKEPLKITIDEVEIQLGNPAVNAENGSFENQFVKFVSSEEKRNLKSILRKPYFVFLIDASEGKQKMNSNFLAQTEALKKKYPEFSENALTYFVNSYSNLSPLKDKKVTQKFEGGYFLDRAIRQEMIRSYQRNDQRYPVFIAVTDVFQNSIIENDFADLEFTFPERKLFYHLEKNGSLSSFSLFGNPLRNISKNAELSDSTEVLTYFSGKKTYFLENNEEASLILKSDMFNLPESEIKEKNWNTAILMQAKYRSEIIHPEIENEQWNSSVKNSFKAKIMTSATSFLVVENEAQKAALKRKQDQVLSGNKSYDADEEMQQMSEPGFYLLIVLVLFFILFKEYKKRKITS